MTDVVLFRGTGILRRRHRELDDKQITAGFKCRLTRVLPSFGKLESSLSSVPLKDLNPPLSLLGVKLVVPRQRLI